MPEGPIRQTFINIPEWAEVLLYLGSLVSIGVLAWGLWRRIRPWQVTRQNLKELFGGDALKMNALQGIRNELLYVFGQKRLLRKQPAGTMHFGLFWGFVLLFIGTALATLDWDIAHLIFNAQFLRGAFYLGYELVLDIAGVVFIAALLYALYRRNVQRPSQLTYLRDFPVTLWSLLTIAVSGFLIEGLRIAFSHPAWGAWSPVGYALSGLFAFMPESAQRGLHFGLWLFHAALSLVWIASISWNENAEHIL